MNDANAEEISNYTISNQMKNYQATDFFPFYFEDANGNELVAMQRKGLLH